MNLTFFKYQSAGNDFVIIDNRAKTFPKNNTDIISFLCKRCFGIGADGLILLENDKHNDFKMLYYNLDGSKNTMCGNGGICIVAFAKKLGLCELKTSFNAVDNLYRAWIKNHSISLQMKDIDKVEIYDSHCFVDTGSPHHVELASNLDSFKVNERGKKIRNELYGGKGSNVNFVEQLSKDSFKIRTYERGVENETLACGTGAVAVAVAMFAIKKTKDNFVKIIAKGGELLVSFNENKGSYNKVFLTGSATFVYKGEIVVNANS
ncbi:MAG: diaminopimelate epimerase [Tenacibaculum sp.]